MELEKKVKIVQAMYAGVLADSVLRLGREGVLEKVTEDKRAEQMQNGKARAMQLGITDPAEVFARLSEIFECANWKTTVNENGFTAEATSCMLCGMAKKMGAQSPCRIYCLDAMEGMVKGLRPDMEYNVRETLWEGGRCLVDVEAGSNL